MIRPHNCLLVVGVVVELLTLSVLPNVQYNIQSTVALGGSTPAFLIQEVNLILTGFHLKNYLIIKNIKKLSFSCNENEGEQIIAFLKLLFSNIL